MKLGNVFLGKSFLNRVAQLKIKPVVAYRLLKYLKQIDEEYNIIEKQRVALIHKITNTEPGTQVELKYDTDEFNEYVKSFDEILSVESELKTDLTIDLIIESLSDENGNELTVQELAQIEPFFS